MQILQILMDDGKLILSEMPDKYSTKIERPHLTKMCNGLGLKQKDIVSMEYVAWNYKEDVHPYYKEASDEMRTAFKLALEGESKLVVWYLFRYSESTGYQLLRPPLIKE